MADIAHGFDGDSLSGDLEFTSGLFTMDDGLKTAVLHSLFSDARASKDEASLVGSEDPRGWWGAELDADGDNYGSKLWLLNREKRTDAVLKKATAYAEEALDWMIQDGVVKSLEIEAEWQKESALALLVKLVLPDGQTETHDLSYPWSA